LTRVAITSTGAATIVFVLGMLWFVTQHHDLLPVTFVDIKPLSLFRRIIGGVVILVLGGIALCLLLARRRTLLDEWLMVALCALPNLDKAKEAFRRIAGDGHRAGALIGTIRANFKSDLRERTSFDLNELIEEALALAHGDLQKHGILVQAEPNSHVPEIIGNR